MLKKQNLPIHGNKSDLIIRLETEKTKTKPNNINKNDAVRQTKCKLNQKRPENQLTRMTRSQAKQSKLDINGPLVKLVALLRKQKRTN